MLVPATPDVGREHHEPVGLDGTLGKSTCILRFQEGVRSKQYSSRKGREKCRGYYKGLIHHCSTRHGQLIAHHGQDEVRIWSRISSGESEEQKEDGAGIQSQEVVVYVSSSLIPGESLEFSCCAVGSGRKDDGTRNESVILDGLNSLGVEVA